MTLAVGNAQYSWQHNLPATPSTSAYGTTLTAHGTSHTKGSWASIIDPVAFDCIGFFIYVGTTFTVTTRTDLLVDIGIGPTGGGSEQVILSNLIGGWRHGSAATGNFPMGIYFPIGIPKGVRVSGRCQALISADTVLVTMFLIQGLSGHLHQACAGADDYGVSTASSGGTSHTAGASGSESSFADIGSTLSKNYRGAIVIPQGTMTDTISNALAYHWELGLGSTTLAEWWYYITTDEFMVGPYPSVPVMTDLPVGSQLQVRAESSGGAPEAQDVGIYCLY